MHPWDRVPRPIGSGVPAPRWAAANIGFRFQLATELGSVLGASPETNCHRRIKGPMQRTLVVIPARMPSTLEPRLAIDCLAPLQEKGPDIATIAAEIRDEAERGNPNVVKVVGTPTAVPGRLRALLFTRATAPHGEGPLYHHIGIYAFRRS